MSRGLRSFAFFLSICTLSMMGAISCAPTLFPIGGTVSGLSGAVVLQNNGGDNLTVSADGVFTFPTGLALNSTYAVSVLTPPSGQTCTVTNGQGTVNGTVSDITVTCSGSSQTYTLGGTVSGLTGTVVLQNSDSQQVSVSADGSFEFATALANGSPYTVTVATPPAGQTCTVNDGSGTISGANVTNVAVVCSETTYTVTGTVSGMTTGPITLQNNGGDDVTLNSDGGFSYPNLADGAVYDITVLTQPPGQVCAVTNGSGTISGADVSDVTVTCVNTLRIFTTTNNYAPGSSTVVSFNSPASADAKCMVDPNYPGSGTYHALIVDGSTRVACTTPNCSGGGSPAPEGTDWVFQPNTPYYKEFFSTIVVVGTTNDAGVFEFPMDNFMGSAAGSAWTGLNSDWTSNTNSCLSWASSSGTNSGSIGSLTSTTDTSINFLSIACSSSTVFLCVEQP